MEDKELILFYKSFQSLGETVAWYKMTYSDWKIYTFGDAHFNNDPCDEFYYVYFGIIQTLGLTIANSWAYIQGEVHLIIDYIPYCVRAAGQCSFDCKCYGKSPDFCEEQIHQLNEMMEYYKYRVPEDI